jgi:CTP:molybdopterin cytidylyltransferase MocA
MERAFSRCAAVILAAGGSSRFGAGAKQLVSLHGRPLVMHAVQSALDAGVFDAIAVVCGAVPLDEVIPDGVVIVPNPDWASGQATSVRAALDWAGAAGFDSVVVGLGDQPGVTGDAWRLVATADIAEPIVVAT